MTHASAVPVPSAIERNRVPSAIERNRVMSQRTDEQ